MDIKDENKLIFLISQPRSGSSMLQQLILNSAKVESVPEPWFMLNLIYTYKENDISSAYNPNYAVINFKNYLKNTEDGICEFKNRIKSLALSLYKTGVAGNMFLDKTPRYYHIIEELHDLFPSAKFIFLTRNPLNVFSSILDYNFKGNYAKFLYSNDRLDDLFLAPKLISKGIRSYPNNIVVKYEDIVNNPKKEIEKIFNYLEVDIPKNSDNYCIDPKFDNTTSVDTKSLHLHRVPSRNYLDSWKKSMNTTQKKILALDYINKLKASKDSCFNYNLDEILIYLKKHRPQKRTIFNLNLGYFITKEENLSLLQIIKKRIFIKLHYKWLKK